MAGDDETTPAAAIEQIVGQLESAGVFSQLGGLESKLTKIVTDLETLGKVASARLQETEDLAAHMLAVEAILEVMMRAAPPDATAVQQAIRERTAELSGNPEGSPSVLAAAAELIGRSRN